MLTPQPPPLALSAIAGFPSGWCRPSLRPRYCSSLRSASATRSLRHKPAPPIKALLETRVLEPLENPFQMLSAHSRHHHLRRTSPNVTILLSSGNSPSWSSPVPSLVLLLLD